MVALKPIRVGVAAPDTIAAKISYALEELLTAARVPHRVERAEAAAGWDLFYGDHPPEDTALWMAASRAAWCFFERPGTRIDEVVTLQIAEAWVRLPDWDPAGRGQRGTSARGAMGRRGETAKAALDLDFSPRRPVAPSPCRPVPPELPAPAAAA